MERVIDKRALKVEPTAPPRVEEQAPPQGEDIEEISPPGVEQTVQPNREDIEARLTLISQEVDVGPRQNRYPTQASQQLNLLAAAVTTAYNITPMEGNMPMANASIDNKNDKRWSIVD